MAMRVAPDVVGGTIVKVSVVICTYRPEMLGHTQDAIESILTQTYPHLECIVVVDGSEALFERLHRQYADDDRTKLLMNERNRGLLASRNRGAAAASGDVVAFIDDDAVADEQWIERLVAAYRREGALAVGGPMTAMWVAGRPASLPEEFYWLVGVTHAGFADGPGEVRNTFGSNLSFRTDVFDRLGGFDTAIGGRKEDGSLQGGETELCVRLRTETGQGVWYTPDAEVAHKVFAYRTRWSWLLRRAFWQGYSKRAMQRLVSDAGRAEEGRFLRRLLTESVPQRVARLVTEPDLTRMTQLVAIGVLTFTVGLGYFYAMLRR